MENEFNETEGFAVISKMIHNAKNQMRTKDAFYFLYWGYIVVAASLLCYFLLLFDFGNKSYFAWLLPFLGVPYSIYYGYSQRKNEKVKTYTGSIVASLWIAFSISVGILVFCGFRISQYFSPIFLLLIATALFTTGRAYNFKPMVWGAIFCWISAGIIFQFEGKEQFLVYAFALIVGYIIPGHLIARNNDV